MSTAWIAWTTIIAEQLSRQLGLEVLPQEIAVPPDSGLGDFSFACFRLAKQRKQAPDQIATTIAAEFSTTVIELSEVNAVGPYVNFSLAIAPAVNRVIQEITNQPQVYGQSQTGAGRSLLLEYAQPNTHKEIHVGHLRNLILGSSLARLLTLAGWNVIPLSYHGDIGAHVAKCLWWLVKKSQLDVNCLEEVQAERLLAALAPDQRTGKFLGELYVEAGQRSSDQPELKDEISAVQRRLEAHEAAWEHLWRETRRWSMEEMAQVFDELGVAISRQYLESEVVDRGQSIVDELLANGIAKESQGAIVIDMEDVKLGVFLIRKSDGTSLYATKDLALAELKLAEYPGIERSLILVDNRQRLYFQQLFEALRRMGSPQRFEFIGYEFVTLPDGAMSSRKGNVITYQALRDEAIAFAREEIMKRHPEWPEGKVVYAAWAIALGGIKFGMLKQDSDRIYVFDQAQALSFEGATGPYCQYAVTRLTSILKKADLPTMASIKRDDTASFDHLSEKRLALVLANLPLRVQTAAHELRPALIAQWCFDAAQAINAFYRDVPILDAAAPQRSARLQLAHAARSALVQGLGLLGIICPDEM